MKHHDQNADGHPEEGRQTTERVSVPVQRDRVVLVRGSLPNLLHVDGVLQLAHVLSVRGDVQQRGQGLGQLDRKFVRRGGEANRCIETSCITSVKIFLFCKYKTLELLLCTIIYLFLLVW